MGVIDIIVTAKPQPLGSILKAKPLRQGQRARILGRLSQSSSHYRIGCQRRHTESENRAGSWRAIHQQWKRSLINNYLLIFLSLATEDELDQSELRL